VNVLELKEKPRKSFNPPLKGSNLKDLCPDHKYLTERGFSKETVQYFESGHFSGEGIMKGKIAIPVHNTDGALVGHVGWQAGKKMDGYEYSKYFRPELEIYNLHRAQESYKKLGFLFLVPDLFDVWRMHEAGFENTIALVNAVLSIEQINLLQTSLGLNGRIFFLSYDDLESEEGVDSLTLSLSNLTLKFFVKMMNFDSTIYKMSPEEIKKALK